MTLLPLEREALTASAEFRPVQDPDDLGAWVVFCLRLFKRTGRIVRGQHLAPWQPQAVDLKGDGSPVTEVDRQVEQTVADALGVFCPDATLVGEELGGTLTEQGYALAVDPIDGTWSFISGSPTLATSLALFKDGAPVLGFVANPATGEVGYTHPSRGARLIQLDLLGEGHGGYELPLSRGEREATLVSLHPSRNGLGPFSALQSAWADGRIQMLRSPGGSPAVALLEASKGLFTYVNLWAKHPAAPYDLTAAVALVRAAGGDVVDLDGRSVDMVQHKGPFVAGTDPEARALVGSLVTEGQALDS